MNVFWIMWMEITTLIQHLDWSGGKILCCLNKMVTYLKTIANFWCTQRGSRSWLKINQMIHHHRILPTKWHGVFRLAQSQSLPASIAIVVAIILYVLLPTRYTLKPTWLMPLLELAMLLPLTLGAPRRVAHEGTVHQIWQL